jgi:hypothetical protein
MKIAVGIILASALTSVANSESGLDYGPWLDAVLGTDAGPSPSCILNPANCPRKWTFDDGNTTVHIWCAPGSKGWAYFDLPGFGGLWQLFCCPGNKQGQHRYVYDKPGGPVIDTEFRCN